VLINVSVLFALVVYAYACLALMRFRRTPAASALGLVGLGFCVWLTLASERSALMVLAAVLLATAGLWLWLRRARAPAARPG
jgi:hypothetical protein